MGEDALRGAKVAQPGLRSSATAGIPSQEPTERATRVEFLDGLDYCANTQGGRHKLGALQITQKGAQPLVRWHVYDIGKLIKVKGGEEIAHNRAARRAHGNLKCKPAENGYESIMSDMSAPRFIPRPTSPQKMGKI